MIDDLTNTDLHHGMLMFNKPSSADNDVIDVVEEDDVVIIDEIHELNNHTNDSKDSEVLSEAAAEKRDD